MLDNNFSSAYANFMKRFLPEINAINQTIVSFNQYLNPTYKVPVLNFERMIEEKNCIQINHGNWLANSFPNAGKRGVYFIFGHEKTNETKNGLYIGKASFDSGIGARLDGRLRRYKDSGFLMMDGHRNEKYISDYAASIDLDSLNLPFLAPALEEYLILELKNSNSINLLNRIGN